MEDNSHHKKNYKWILMLSGFILIIVAIVLILLYFMQGTTTTEDSGSTVSSIQSLSCEGTKTEYPFFTAGEISDHSLKINATFNDDKLDDISLTYKATYKDGSTAKQNTSNNSIAMTDSFAESGLPADALDKHFSTINDATQVSLYADHKEISGSSAKYFLLEDANGSYNINNLEKIYTGKGLKCTKNTKDNK